MNMMSIIVKCNNCGNQTEMKSEYVGHQIYLHRLLRDADFSIDTPNFEYSGELDEIDDVDDIEVRIREVRISCQKCGDYIELQEFQ